jgi:dihydroorotase
MTRLDLVIRGGRVIDPSRGVDGTYDVGIRDGCITELSPKVAGRARRRVDARGRLVVPGMIDTHAHVYQHVTGDFGMNPDEVGVRSGVTTLVDQGGAGALTFQGFRKFIAEPARSRVFAFLSNYLVGGLSGHRYVDLYGPHGINVRETVRTIDANRDIVKGIKCHAEIGGYSRWGIETLRLGKQASREAGVPVYVHLGQLWADEAGTRIDPDDVLRDVLPLLDPGDILAHPFTKHPGAFVSKDGQVHPLIFEAMKLGARIDIGRGGHLSFRAARIALDAGVMPFTVGADIHGYTIRRRTADDELRTIKWHSGTPIGGSGVHSLVQVMNELLALGLDLVTVVRMVTANAATMLGLDGEIGTLAPGAVADVSILALDDGDWTLEDSAGVQLPLSRRLRLECALRAGAVVPADSSLLFESRPAEPEIAARE